MTDAIPQAVALDFQLAMVAGVEREGYFEVRAIGAHPIQRFVPLEDRAGAAEEILELDQRANTYVAAAPRRRRSGGADAVERGYALWADLDGPEALERLAAFSPRPTLVLASGSPGCAHAWWQITATPLAPRELERANRRLAHALGGDMRATDAARILRPCGTRNHKHSPPTPVQVVELEPERSYRAEEIVGDLGDPPEPERAPRPASAVRGSRHDPLKAIPACEYVELLAGVVAPRDDVKICCPLPGHQDRIPSFHVGGPDPAAWHCFGACDVGGGVYELAGHLWGASVPLRGDDFRAVRELLLERFGMAA